MNDNVSETLKKWRQSSFGYDNQNDCLLSLADYLIDCGYSDFGKKFRGKFNDEKGALNFISEYGSVEKIIDETGNSISNEITQTGNKISNEISEVKESSQKVISEGISNFNPIESVKNVFETNSTSQSQHRFTSNYNTK